MLQRSCHECSHHSESKQKQNKHPTQGSNQACGVESHPGIEKVWWSIPARSQPPPLPAIVNKLRTDLGCTALLEGAACDVDICSMYGTSSHKAIPAQCGNRSMGTIHKPYDIPPCIYTTMIPYKHIKSYYGHLIISRHTVSSHRLCIGD